MKFGRVQLGLILPLLVSIPQSYAGNFMAVKHASLVGQVDKDMPETKHNKTAGDGYEKGSPLYNKQQKIDKADKKAAAPEAPAAGKTLFSVPYFGSLTLPPADQSSVPFTDQYFKARGGVQGHLKLGITFFLQYFIFVMLIALVWMKCANGRNRTGYGERENTGKGFAYGLFSTDHCIGPSGHHSNVCIFSWCCSPLRMADTYSKEPFALIGNFWTALLLVTCLIGLSQLSGGLTSLTLFGLAIYYRQQLRKQYGLDSGGRTWVMDCCSWLWCPCCSMAQEARQVEFVLKPGAPGK